MNKQQAIAAAKNGQKITHRLFAPGEWFTITTTSKLNADRIFEQQTRYVFEDGAELLPAIFWEYRTAPIWEDGYNIFEPQTT